MINRIDYHIKKLHKHFRRLIWLAQFMNINCLINEILITRFFNFM